MTVRELSLINVSHLIDDGSVTRFQVLVIGLCSLVAFLDGLDSLSIAVAAPLIADSLGLAKSALGPIFSAALLGAMIGALTFGALGDRYGRKRILIAAVMVFAVFTFTTAHVTSYPTLLAARFAAGLGLGGATPCFIALASEYAPSRRRAMVASLIWAAFPLGGAIGGFLNAYILTHFGWQAIFLVGGIVPLLVTGALWRWVPESIGFLLASRADQSRIGAIVERIKPGLPVGVLLVGNEVPITGTPLKHLFAKGRVMATLLLWTPFFTSFGTLALIVYWMPELLRGHGIALSQSSVVIGVNSMGALMGMASAGWLIDRFGARRILIPSMLLGACATGILGFAATSVASISLVMMVLGLSVGLSASGSVALASLTYPTAIRSSGVGWAMGMGRFGQVLAPLFASSVTAAGWPDTKLFLCAALAPLVGAIATSMLVGAHRSAVNDNRQVV
jgi:AAHS family 4-hydroxybenzoate transporter-like MFS transporter